MIAVDRLGQLLNRAAQRWPQRTAIHVHGDVALTYTEIATEAAGVGASLPQRHPGAAWRLLLPNSSAFVAVLYGCALAGRTAVLLNPRLTGAELAYQIDQADTDLLITGDAPGRPIHSPVALSVKVVADLPELVWCGRNTPAGLA